MYFDLSPRGMVASCEIPNQRDVTRGGSKGHGSAVGPPLSLGQPVRVVAEKIPSLKRQASEEVYEEAAMPFDGKNTPLRDFLLLLRAQRQRRAHRELRAALP